MTPTEVAGARVGAALIDLLLYTVVCGALFFVMADSSQGFVFLDSPQVHITAGDTIYYVDGPAAGVYWLLTIVIASVHFGLLPGLTGWTPGKLATGLRVRRADGSRAGLGANLARAGLWLADGFPYFLPGLVGLVMVLARSDRRRVADLVAGTVVAHKSWAGEPAASSATPAGVPGPAWPGQGGPEAPR
jgi:uncharacterized RDD family membrane protein YckC